MSQQNPLEVAKQGNPNAIAALINRSLKPKGITAKVSRKDDCLRVMLESNTVPDQDNLVRFIRNGVLKLEISEINTLQIFGRQVGDKVPVWSQTIHLKTPLLYLNNQQGTRKPHNPQTHSEQSTISHPQGNSFSGKIDSSSTSNDRIDAKNLVSSTKTSSRKVWTSLTSSELSKKSNNLLSLLNSSSENNPIVQWVGIIFFSLFAFMMWWVLGRESNSFLTVTGSRNSSGITIPIITAPDTVTFNEYNRLEYGMSYNEAIAIIGEPGQENSRVEMPETPVTIMYSWQNSNGSNMSAIFQDDKLVTKAQVGLK